MIIDQWTLIQVRVPPSITAVPPGGAVTGPTTTFPTETVPKTIRTKVLPLRKTFQPSL